MSSYTALDTWKYNMEFFPEDAHNFKETDSVLHGIKSTELGDRELKILQVSTREQAYEYMLKQLP
jgi:hypothetical protein